jgi:hypothetical protein
MERRALLLGAALLAAAPATRAGDECAAEGVPRIVAVGDVHGAYDSLVAILRAAGVIDEKLRWSGGRTHLVQTGDVVDRGPDSRKALDLLRRLEKEAGRAKGAVHALIGNHELMWMLGDLRYVSAAEYASFATRDSEAVRERALENVKPEARDELRKQTPLGYLELVRALAPDGEYGKWLRGHDAVVKLNGVLFLHGGISPRVAALPCAEINAAVRREITEDLQQTRKAPLASLGASEDGPLWYRGLAQEPDAFQPEVEKILAAQGARAVVIAHTPAPGGRIRSRFGGRVVQIDTGMLTSYVTDGRASALEIKDGTFTAIYLDRRDVIPGIQ